ncbi:unnamed protein product [Sphagnum compactum]
MNAGALRRRVHHEDVGGKKNERMEFAGGADGLDEPLLEHDGYQSPRPAHVDDSDDDWKEKKRREEQAWTQNFSRLITLWAQWFTNAVVGGGAWVGSTLFRLLLRRQSNGTEAVKEIYLSPIQEERLEYLQQCLSVPFDGSRAEHQDALRALWHAAFPDRTLPGLVSEQWKEMGWQGTDPSTDFRGGGFISLQNLLFFSQKFPASFHRLLHKQDGKRATWEYPFAVAGLNISFMLIQMLDLKAAKPTSMSGITFLKILAEDEMAFDMLYCVAFEMLDAHWLAMRASYMEFNAVLNATRTQLEREMMLEDVHHVEDLPAFNLLCPSQD